MQTRAFGLRQSRVGLSHRRQRRQTRGRVDEPAVNERADHPETAMSRCAQVRRELAKKPLVGEQDGVSALSNESRFDVERAESRTR